MPTKASTNPTKHRGHFILKISMENTILGHACRLNNFQDSKFETLGWTMRIY